ncbi:hypothetical protein J7K06_01750 [Candidatus Bathyarchaeota archaeon]|nr:hypothetical protein [Candidatus Bathyarchaeota archaeon]
MNPASLRETISVCTTDGVEFYWTKEEQAENLLTNDEKSRRIIEQIMAKAISKQQLARGWFVESYKRVYYWSFTLTEQLSMGLMDVYPGFIFKPYVYDDGSCAVMIDPKFKFVPRKTLRDIIDQMLMEGKTHHEIISLFENEIVIDACPVIDCPFRKDPSSNCHLKGAGKRRILSRLDFNLKPSIAKFGNLITYHKQKCPNNGRLGRLIEDKPPLAIVESKKSGKLFEFPLERLRKELKLHELDKFGRILVTKYIRPSMKERWYLTRGFLAYLDGIRIGRLPPLRLVKHFVDVGKSPEKPWYHYTVFEDMPLMFANRKIGFDPFSALEAYGPYDLTGKHRRKFNKLRIIIYNFSDKLTKNDIERFYRDLVNGFSYRPSYSGIKRIFRLEVPAFGKGTYRRDTFDVRIPFLNKNEALIVLAVAPENGNRKIKQYKFFKQELTRLGIPCQFILDKNIQLANSISKYSGFMKNLALCIYHKVGGVAWILSKPVGNNKCFVGLDMISRHNRIYMSLHVFNSYGLWLGGDILSVKKEFYPQVLVDKVNEAIDIYTREERMTPEELILHKNGEVWPNIELKPLIDGLTVKSRIVSIKKTGIPRVYNVLDEDYISDRGLCVQIDKNEALLVTSGPPHQIQGSQKPLTVEIKYPKGNWPLLRETCKEIFYLSLLYGGYLLAVTSRPITTHLASAAVSLAANYDINEVSEKLSKKAWFI